MGSELEDDKVLDEFRMAVLSSVRESRTRGYESNQLQDFIAGLRYNGIRYINRSTDESRWKLKLRVAVCILGDVKRGRKKTQTENNK